VAFKDNQHGISLIYMDDPCTDNPIRTSANRVHSQWYASNTADGHIIGNGSFFEMLVDPVPTQSINMVAHFVRFNVKYVFQTDLRFLPTANASQFAFDFLTRRKYTPENQVASMAPYGARFHIIFELSDKSINFRENLLGGDCREQY